MANLTHLHRPSIGNVLQSHPKRKFSSSFSRFPFPLYDKAYEHDACGVAFIADIRGRKTHTIISQSLTALENLKHRGAYGAEENTGDGAGVIVQIPHTFFTTETKHLGFILPAQGSYAVGVLFLSQDKRARNACWDVCVKTINKSQMRVLGFRDVPTNNNPIGKSAKDSEPFIRQVFIAKNKTIKSVQTFERMLYLIRRMIENAIAKSTISIILLIR